MADLSFLRRFFFGYHPFESLAQRIETGTLPVAAEGLSSVHAGLVVAAAKERTGKKALVITADEAEAARMCADIRQTGLNALLFPARDVSFASVSSTSREYEHKRTHTLSEISEGAFDVVAAPVEAVLQQVLPPEVLVGSVFSLSEGDSLGLQNLTDRLIRAGYTRVEQVDGSGTFAVRGGIMDLFCTDMSLPVRIEFWGDEVDTISLFDPDTQRRTERIKAIKISPASDTAALCDRLINVLNEYSETHELSPKQTTVIREDIDRLSAGISVPYDRYSKAIYKDNCTLLDYLSDTVCFVFEESAVRAKINSLAEYGSEMCKQMLAEGCYFPDLSLTPPSTAEFEQKIDLKNTVFLENFITKHKSDIKATYAFNVNRLGIFGGDISLLAEDLREISKQNGKAVIVAANRRAADSLILSLSDEGITSSFFESISSFNFSGVVVTLGALSSGISLPERKITVISACREAATAPKRKKIKRDSNAKEITSLEELKRGDYVVHASHGIGVFDGIHAITTSGITKDYIKINYAGTDVLYVPVTMLDLVSKYIGSSEDIKIKVNRLSGSDWQNTRKRVRSAVRDIAKELTALYAKRMQAKGYAFSPDTDMQSDFERRFAFDETEDQLKCINEIKNDMERETPMDRLLCGDVGFGKTEVALRAAFKAVSDGKQCAILVPTTILAWQHFQTIKNRFAHFPVEIGMLSRFVSPKEQKKIISGLQSGMVDIVVGTHRMISNDVKFKDLGLVIVDEEQRFGVAQKEKLKDKYPSVDVLTLSATPIPRTLNMALSGLRDMSGIDEAPGDRYPVQTYVMEQNNSVLYEAISKELRRSGQVYYLHNRVESIDRTAMRLKNAFPDARVGVAHGKMSEDALSDVWRKLIEHEIDILVCTTIIETGVDVTNANTLIIEDADRMGLAQLHQLRGRVGRSSRRAYAYFCYKPMKAISEIATQRLEAMREYTEFGSGFRIALRDLEIRGAGSILGAEQHGNLEAVGYDMYMKMLSDAISEQNGVVNVSENECSIDLNIPAHIPEDYIPALSQRLGMYRRIASIRTKEDIGDVIDELCDRFGEPPKAVLGLMDIAHLRSVAAECGITEIRQQNDMLLLFINQIDPESVSKMAAAFGKDFFLSAGTKPYFSIKQKKGTSSLPLLEKITEVLQ